MLNQLQIGKYRECIALRSAAWRPPVAYAEINRLVITQRPVWGEGKAADPRLMPLRGRCPRVKRHRALLSAYVDAPSEIES